MVTFREILRKQIYPDMDIFGKIPPNAFLRLVTLLVTMVHPRTFSVKVHTKTEGFVHKDGL